MTVVREHAQETSGEALVRRARWRWVHEEASETRSWVYRFVSVLIVLGVGALYLVTTVHVPGVLGSVLSASFAQGPGIQELVVLATPFFLTGMAVQIPRRVGLWNIGGEGQFFFGAWLATAFAFALPHLPGPVLIIGMLVAGALGGAAWMLIPMLAKTLLNVNEIITTLMLNLVATFWIAYWITGPWRYASTQGGTIDSRFLPTQSNLPLVHLSGGLDSGFIIAVLITVAVGVSIRSSTFGYRTHVVGSGRSVAAYAGMPVRKLVAASLLIGGAMAGVGGVLQLIGNSHQLTPGMSDNTGYLGIAVAVLAGSSILGVLVMSCLFAIVMSVGVSVQIYGISSEDVFILIGILLILATLAEVLAHYRLVRSRTGPITPRGDDAAPASADESLGERTRGARAHL